MRLHVVQVTWNEGDEESTVKESVACLVVTLEEEILLSSTYDGMYDMFPVVFSVPNRAVIELRTICLIEI